MHYCVMASHDTVNLLWIVICYLHCAYVQRESKTKCVGVITVIHHMPAPVSTGVLYPMGRMSIWTSSE